MIYVDKKMMLENFPKLKRCDHSPNRDEFIDVSLDPPYFSLDSPFKEPNSSLRLRAQLEGFEYHWEARWEGKCVY